MTISHDLRCSTEVIATIQAFLDARAQALPRLARQRRQLRETQVMEQDESMEESYGDGIDFAALDFAGLGGSQSDPVQEKEGRFAIVS